MSEPVGLKTSVQLGVVLAITGSVFALGVLFAQVERLQEDYQELKIKQEQLPTKSDYQFLKEGVDRIEKALSIIVADLKNK